MSLFQEDTRRWSLGQALAYWLFITAFLGVVAIGLTLNPSPSGVGTHEQLGLPPCGFLVLTGIPCPSCGLTTSIAFLLHGDVSQALSVQPFGVALAGAMLWGVSLAAVGLLQRKSLCALVNDETLERLQIGMLILLLICWVYKIAIF